MSQSFKDAVGICKAIIRNGYDAYVINAKLQKALLAGCPQPELDVCTDAGLDELQKLFPNVSQERGESFARLKEGETLINFYHADAADASHPEECQVRLTSRLAKRLTETEELPPNLACPYLPRTEDPLDGFADFSGGIIRFKGIQDQTLRQDYLRAIRAIERADVALLVIDATTGITAQDTHIAGFILEAWKSTVVVVNKWDAVEKDNDTMNAYTEKIRQELNFMDYVPILFISAKTGKRVDQVLPMAVRVQEERLVRLSTSQLNKVIQDAQARHQPTTKSGQTLKIYYGTQVRSDPPTFMLYCNDPKLAHFSYRRFLENRIRENYNYLGTPIRLVFKSRREK